MSAAASTRQPADIAPIAALFADPTRARIVTALLDGRALPASVIAAEAGVAASTVSEHLARLVAGEILSVEPSGRHRYFRVAGPHVAAVVEVLSVLAPQPPVRSLRESTRAAALRRARTCYDHLAGRLGVAVTEGLVTRRALTRTDGRPGTVRTEGDPLAAALAAHPYELGPRATPVLAELGIALGPLLDRPATARPVLRFCVDWSEQRHHLAGALGAALLSRAEAAGWVTRRPRGRALDLTAAGREAFRAALGIELQEPATAA